MTGADAVVWIGAARSALERVNALAAPFFEDASEAGGELERAAQSLANALAVLQSQPRARNPEARRALDEFRRECNRARTVHAHAGAWLRGWRREITGAAEADYSRAGAGGTGGLAIPGRCVSVQG